MAISHSYHGHSCQICQKVSVHSDTCQLTCEFRSDLPAYVYEGGVKPKKQPPKKKRTAPQSNAAAKKAKVNPVDKEEEKKIQGKLEMIMLHH